MSIVQNVLIGRTRRSIGNATFQKWKDKNVLRSKPTVVNQPNTVAQLTQREKMKQVIELARRIMPSILLGFKERAVSNTEYNAFTSYTLKNAATGTTPGNVTINPTNILISNGTIAAQPIVAMSADASDSEIEIEWNPALDMPGHLATDKLNVVVMNSNTGQLNQFFGIANRSAGTFTISSFAGMTAGNILRVYTYFTRADSSKSDVSVHTQITVAA